MPYEGGGGGHSSRPYCQVCCSAIWVYLQSSVSCRECAYSAHLACLEGVTRECVAAKVRAQPDFILDICPEKSLPSLRFRCVECDRRLSWTNPDSQPRLCDYTGLSFCPSCHWGASAVTPARVLHNWDFQPQPVSQAAGQYLHLMHTKPVINVTRENPKLLAVVHNLQLVHALREKVIVMKKYLVVCRIAAEKKLLLHLSDRQHFVDGAAYYSMQDLMDIESGALVDYLHAKTELFAEHIRTCVLCVAKGFVCEICNEEGEKKAEVIFPFEDGSSACKECGAVFHRQCFKTVPGCPRCERKKRRDNNSDKGKQ